ncbi:hypothetical protein WA026_005896 [Henosepilachna vigintioctopunctata]|uniref:Peptide deformylase n=1 Tax=Henosepilachna vigintioctopunctata TaxID=420089 RepID=A0AAW1U5D8_9CUCU
MLKANPLNIYNYFHCQIRKASYKSMMTWYSGLLPAKPIPPPHKHIIQIGDPRLRSVSQEIPYDDIETSEIQRLIGHIKHIFKTYNCLGLSASQIGISKRMFIMGISKKLLEEYSSKEQEIKEITFIEPTVVINPKIKITDFKRATFNESCGSIKGFCADVPRYYGLQLEGYNEFAEPLKIDASGFTARIIQHEMDHLDGKLFTDIMDRKTLSCSCWEVVNERNGKVELPYGPK